MNGKGKRIHDYREVGQGDSFHHLFMEQLQRSPYILISLCIHLAIMGLLYSIDFISPRKDLINPCEAKIEDQRESLLEEKREKPDLNPPEEEMELEEFLPEEAEADIPDENPGEEEDEKAAETFLDTGKDLQEVIGIPAGGGRAFRGRRAGRGRGIRGGRGTQKHVEWGLDWLARHQSGDGSWDCDGFDALCTDEACTGLGHPLYDEGVTGLALLAFLGAGYTHEADSPYRRTVAAGLKYLRNQQDSEGCFGSKTLSNYTYGHAICALAMAEAYGMTKSSLFKLSAQQGIAYVLKCRNPYMAWRYGERPGDNDTSVTGWMVMALKSGQLAGLSTGNGMWKGGVKKFLDEVTDEQGDAGYTLLGNGPVRGEGKLEAFPCSESKSTTAVATLTRIFLGENPKTSRMVKRGAALCLSKLPVWDVGAGKVDMYYWYYGTLALFQADEDHWEKWNEAMKAAILNHQVQRGCAKGSWDPVGAWGEEGGRVYSTALLTMCLEVYYRYDRVFGIRSER